MHIWHGSRICRGLAILEPEPSDRASQPGIGFSTTAGLSAKWLPVSIVSLYQRTPRSPPARYPNTWRAA